SCSLGEPGLDESPLHEVFVFSCEGHGEGPIVINGTGRGDRPADPKNSAIRLEMLSGGPNPGNLRVRQFSRIDGCRETRMFRYFSLAVKNTIRNRRRSILTICSIAASLCLLGVLFAIYNAMFYKEATPGAALRVVVRHRVSLAQAMPYSYEAKIRQVPGVKEVSTWDWFQGVYKDQRDPKNFFARFGVEPAAFLTIRTQMNMPDDQRRAFLAERTACVISKDISERLNVHLGDRIVIVGDIYPVTLELTVRGIFEDPDGLNSLFFNRDYLRESLTGARRDQAGTFAVLVDSPENVPRVSKAIDDMFDNAPQPTKTESEQQFLL